MLAVDMTAEGRSNIKFQVYFLKLSTYVSVRRNNKYPSFLKSLDFFIVCF